MLQEDAHLNNIFSERPLVAYKQPPNLLQILTSDSLSISTTTVDFGTAPCKLPKCQLCCHINRSNFITGPNNKYFIKGSFTCTSANVLHSISQHNIYWRNRKLDPAKNEWSQSDIRKHKNTPVANHFNLPQHTLENLQVMVLRRLNCNRRQRQIDEQKMIARLDTTARLNQDLGFLSHYFPNS